MKRMLLILILLCVRWSPTPGFMRSSVIEQILCKAQCLACHYVEITCLCEDNLEKNRYWIYDTKNCSDLTECSGSCSTLGSVEAISFLPDIPNIKLGQTENSKVLLEWNKSFTSYVPMFVILFQVNGGSWEIYDLTWDNYTAVSDLDHCKNYTFKVAAVNQFGSLGFSKPFFKGPEVPGMLSNIHVASSWHHKNDTAEFEVILKWDQPKGWSKSDITTYTWRKIIQTCDHSRSSSKLDLTPFFDDLNMQSTTVKFRIHDDAFGCVYILQIKAKSRCGIDGLVSYFSINLTDCKSFRNYLCPTPPFEPPDNVWNVTIINKPDRTVFVSWLQPKNLGSAGIINEYAVRWGNVIIVKFIGMPSIVNPKVVTVPKTCILLKPDAHPNLEKYGLQIIPLAPGQIIQDNQWGLFPVYIFEHKGSSKNKGHMPMVTQIPYTKSVKVFLTSIDDNDDQSEIIYNRFAVQWGPLKKLNDSNTSTLLTEEGSTIVPWNATLIINVTETDIQYGLKFIPLRAKEHFPNNLAWENLTTFPFVVEEPPAVEKNKRYNKKSERVVPPKPLTPTVSEASQSHSSLQYTGLYVGLGFGIPIVIMAVFFTMKKKTKFLHLEVQGQAEDSNNVYDVVTSAESVQRSHNVRSLNSPVLSSGWEIPVEALKFGEILGRGAFGQVVKAEIDCTLLTGKSLRVSGFSQGSPLICAVKLLHESSEDIHKIDFLKEIELMKETGYHANIVSMLGCCTLEDPICLVVEHVSKGDLLSYLKTIRHHLEQEDENCGHYINNGTELIGPVDLLSFAWQITIGMEFLSQKGFVHRDLAARNILVGENMTAKIGDFGLARYIYDDKIYVNRKGGKLPLKWMSIEAIFDLTFSTASDIWSFGVVLFEIVTLGGTPYPTIDNKDLLKELKQGYRMDKPENCSQQLYQVMLACWQERPLDRPGFSRLKHDLERLIEDESGHHYLEMTLSDNQSYYSMQAPSCGKDSAADFFPLLHPSSRNKTDTETIDQQPDSIQTVTLENQHYNMSIISKDDVFIDGVHPSESLAFSRDFSTSFCWRENGSTSSGYRYSGSQASSDILLHPANFRCERLESEFSYSSNEFLLPPSPAESINSSHSHCSRHLDPYIIALSNPGYGKVKSTNYI